MLLNSFPHSLSLTHNGKHNKFIFKIERLLEHAKPCIYVCEGISIQSPTHTDSHRSDARPF